MKFQQKGDVYNMEVILICDGSAIGNPGPGGFGAILKAGSKELVLTGGHPATTNNRMELSAAIEGLRALRTPCHVELVTDSQYVRNGITEWLPRWQARGWVSSSGKPVLNQDLWYQLAELVQQHEVHWSWTPGHTGTNPDQEQAHDLAYRAAREQAAPVVSK
jgi:ribonuclease HI